MYLGPHNSDGFKQIRVNVHCPKWSNFEFCQQFPVQNLNSNRVYFIENIDIFPVYRVPNIDLNLITADQPGLELGSLGPKVATLPLCYTPLTK